MDYLTKPGSPLSVLAELTHHGVKGMKWGVRKDQYVLNKLTGVRTVAAGEDKATKKSHKKQGKADWKSYKKSTTRKERKEDKRKALLAKGQQFAEQALKQPKSLFVLTTGPNNRYLATGKEVAEHLKAGGRFDVKTSYLAAEYTDD